MDYNTLVDLIDKQYVKPVYSDVISDSEFYTMKFDKDPKDRKNHRTECNTYFNYEIEIEKVVTSGDIKTVKKLFTLKKKHYLFIKSKYPHIAPVLKTIDLRSILSDIFMSAFWGNRDMSFITDVINICICNNIDFTDNYFFRIGDYHQDILLHVSKNFPIDKDRDNKIYNLAISKNYYNLALYLIENDRMPDDDIHDNFENNAKILHWNAIVYFITKLNYPIDCIQCKKCRSLIMTMVANDLQKLIFIIDHGYVINNDDYFNLCQGENGRNIIYLIENNYVDITCINNLLGNAILSRNDEIVDYILNNYLDVCNININHMLIHACRKSNFRLVKYFVEHGADVQYCDNEAVICAYKEYSFDIVEYLIEHGADLKAQNFLLCRPITYSNNMSYLRIISDGVDLVKIDEELLLYAVQYSTSAVINYLIDIGYDVNDYPGACIRMAYSMRTAEILELLLMRGANTDHIGYSDFKASSYYLKKNLLLLKYGMIDRISKEQLMVLFRVEID